MKKLDKYLQRLRISVAGSYIERGMSVLDIGCADGALFRQIGNMSPNSLGIDPVTIVDIDVAGVRLVPGLFPEDMPHFAGKFDVLTMLAVIEHYPVNKYEKLARGCAAYLKPGGRLIITVPSPIVDKLLMVLKYLNLIDGMSLDEHHEFDVKNTKKIFSLPCFRLIIHKKFQLGFNNLFVFEKAITPFTDCQIANRREWPEYEHSRHRR